MSRLILFCLLLIFKSLPISAQLSITDKRYPDSLVELTKSAPNDSTKARVFFKLSDYWAKIDSVKAKVYLAKGLKSGLRYPYIKALYYYFQGRLYSTINPQKSEQNYIEADKQLAAFNTNEAFLTRAKGWANYANIQQRKDNEDLMVNILLNKAIPLAKKSGSNEYLGKFYGDLGLVFGNQLQYDKAEKYYLTAISILEQTKLTDHSILFLLYLYISKAYIYNHNDKVSLTRNILAKAKNLLPMCPTPINYIEYYWVEGMYYRKIKAYDRALVYIGAGMSFAKQLQKPYYEEKLNAEKINILTAKGDFKKAAIVLESLIKTPQSKYSINLLNYYEEISHIYDTLGNSKIAYQWLKKYSKLKDSLTKQDMSGKINALEIRFKTAENQKKIAELNTINQKANLSTRNSHLLNWLLGTATLLILSALIFGLYYYHNQKKLIDQKEQIRLTNAVLQGQEIERNRVARDLHDGLGNMLAVVKFNLWQFAKEKPAAELDEIIHHLDHSVNELRRIAHDMMPEMLLNIGLEAALKDLCESLSSDELEVDCQLINIKNTISQPIQIAIYRIVQELLTNVVKHAEARNVFLQCTQNKQFFFITLEDDGKGFDANLQNEKTGIGLSNIKSRVAYLNGKMEIISKPNQPGTSINIELNVKA
jgi:two-component system NarL family sensor kinase